MKNFSNEIFMASCVLTAALILNITIALLIGNYGWDDGTITLAYSKTLAESGRFALSEASEIVEGSSSMFLVFVSAIAYKIFNFSFEGFITFSQLMALVYLALACFTLFHALEDRIHKNRYRLIIVSLVGLVPLFTKEIMNGMEMTSFTYFLLIFVIYLDKKSNKLYYIIPIILLIRFEAIYYICFTFFYLALLNKGNRAYHIRFLLYTAGLFALMTAMRWFYFGDIIPNTLYAKLHPPYSPIGLIDKIKFKFSGLQDFFSVYLYFILVIFLLAPFDGKKLINNSKFAVILAFCTFSFITGQNAGYSGRMTEACLPIFILLLIEIVPFHNSFSLFFDEKIRLKISKESSIIILIIACLFLETYNQKKLFLDNIKRTAHAGYLRNAYPDSLNSVFKQWTYSDNPIEGPVGPIPANMGATPELYRSTAIAVLYIGDILKLKTINYVVPDVGGVGLCCSNINILDSGLLTNHFLAKNGYEKFDEFLHINDADIIETHGLWSDFSKIYQATYFQNNYIPVIAQNNLLWLNKKYLGQKQQLESNGIVFVTKNTKFDNIRYAVYAIDLKYLEDYLSGSS